MPGSIDSPQAEPLLPAWNAFLDGLRELAPAMLDKLPGHLRDDPQTQHEIGRLMLSALAARSIDAIAKDGDHPMFLPSLNVVLNVFQPNADTVYKTAHITPGGSYRLRGRAGSLRIAKIGTMAPPSADGAIQASTYHDINSLKTDEDGSFDVLLSPFRPPDHAGDWWELDPRAHTLLLRQVAYDWSAESDPAISIERLDVPPNRPRPAATDLARRLHELAPGVSRTAMLLIEHVAQLQREGFVNKFKVWDVASTHGGLFGQFYYECAYELEHGEALLIESDYPETCAYASLILTNQIFETTDWYNNHSSLNGSQWRLDSDRRLRVVVSATDPGVPNWLDTAGYPTGVVQGRWTDCSSNPLPSARKVAVADVLGMLPPDTPRITRQERERIIRERRARLQQRPLW
ncbi:hypothetical protein [Actinomadura rudentiformis]|uniref:DUF1214 domain-containing protein n=1 Tax=Actinomadura rudentiformis TaxID=359158 RepID=A0A6H9YJP6_9ACTN|nr:hypothetical protein [Actinomadura rudentiformis]KAB2341595.1 hypothetical protein F8566_41420 [Actinomadura rudentiformis]